jgi:putative two-component system response regulator
MTLKTATKILIVDDEFYIRDILSQWLTEEGYECVTAGNVDEACKLLTENSFSLALLDMMMPEKPGTVILHRLREDYPQVAVLMVTALDDPGISAETHRLGAYGYITKPFDRDEIVGNISSALRRREEMRQAGESQKRLEQELRELKSG